MNPEEIIAREAERIGRPLTAAEKAEIRGGATRLESVATVADFNEAPEETPAERTAREARESAAERDARMAELEGNDTGFGDWLSDLPTTLRGDRSEGVHPVREALADWTESGRSGTSGLVEGATMGLSDEVLGAIEAGSEDPLATASAFTGSDVGEMERLRERYRAARDRRRAAMASDAADNPALFATGVLAGGSAVPLPGAGAVARGATAGSRIVRGAGLGAAAGGVGAYGASTRETTDPAIAGDVAEGAALGAAGGAAATGLAEGVGAAVRGAPHVRTGADRALLAVPSGAGGVDRLTEALGSGVGPERLSTAARRVREAGLVGPLSSSADVAERAERAMAGASSAPFEARMEGMVLDRARLARALEDIARRGEASAIEAPAYGPLREAAGRLAPPPRPAPPPRTPSRALPPPTEVPGTPTRPDAPRAGLAAETRLPGRETVPRGPSPEPMLPETTEVGPTGREPTRAYERPLPPVEPDLEGTLPPDLGMEPAELEAFRNRLRAHRAGGAGPSAEPATGAARPGARGRAAPPPPAEPPPAPRESSPAAMAPTMAPGGGTEMGVGPSYRAPAGPELEGPLTTVYRPAPRAPVVRPAAERPLGARRYEGPGVRPEDVMPIVTPGEGPRRSGPGSLMYEMRAARDAADAAAGTGPSGRVGPAERMWSDAGRVMRDAADEAYGSRYGTEGPEGLDAYRAARRVESTAIPVRREALRGAARGADMPPGLSAREMIAGHAYGPLGHVAAIAGRGRLGAINAAGRDLAARALESPTASAAARAAPEVSRRLTAGGGTAAGAGVSREATADERRRSRLREILGSESRLSGPVELDAITGASEHVEPTSGYEEPPAGSASPTTRSRPRRAPSGRARRALDRILGRH